MSVATTGGDPVKRPGHTTQTLSQATATQEVLSDTDVTTLSGGTATGFTGDTYSLEDTTEGREHDIVMLATGEAYVGMTGTATGRLVFTGADDYARLRFTAAKWRIQVSSATIATAT